MPGIIIASFGDEETKSSQMHFAKCSGHLSLGNLHHLHRIYRAVVHDEMSVTKATTELEEMLESGPMNPTLIRLLLAFSIGALICPIAFGGSFVDMFLAGCGSLVLTCIQTYVASRRSVIYANVYEYVAFSSHRKSINVTLQDFISDCYFLHRPGPQFYSFPNLLLCLYFVVGRGYNPPRVSHPYVLLLFPIFSL